MGKTKRELLEAEIEKFNEAVAVGDEVTATDSTGQQITATTKGKAWYAGGMAVVCLRGRGIFLLKKVNYRGKGE